MIACNRTNYGTRNVMAGRVLKETKSLSAIETQPPSAAEVEAVSVRCYCCGLTEECTVAYIARVRERYQGRWICGLCAEAVKDETVRSQRDMSTDEAMKRHMKFCQQFRTSSPPNNPTEELIEAMKQLLLRTLESPRKEGMTCRPLGRSQSCFSTMQKESEHQEGCGRNGVSVE